jgi:hypothetical protein
MKPWALTPKGPFSPKRFWVLLITLDEASKIVVIFWNFIESRELNELQDKVIFSYRRFLDQKLCGFLDLKAN